MFTQIRQFWRKFWPETDLQKNDWILDLPEPEMKSGAPSVFRHKTGLFMDS